jgi:tRNA A-37 threonylcarbamoyl transferase component Bud32
MRQGGLFRWAQMNSRRIEYKCRKSLTRTVCCDTELSAEFQKALWLGDVERLLFTSKPLQEKDRCIVALYKDAGLPLVVKRHTWGGTWRTLRMAWREPSARRCARLGRYLSDHGIPTPRPRAWVEQRLGPMRYRSYLFTDFIDGTSLYRFIRSGKRGADTLEHLAKQVAGIWQRMVELGVRHGDLKPENFIVDPDLRVWILDLERTRLGRRAKRRGERQLADLDVFLHIRGWHHQFEAREVFRRALARTEAGRQLGLPAREQSKSAAARATEVDAGLRVLVLCNGAEFDGASAEQAVESVRDIADEVVIGTCRGVGGQFECTTRLQLCHRDGGDCEWLLVLHQNERVTPVLAKRLQEAITRRTSPPAFRIAIERQFFGRNIAIAGAAAGSIRLFRPDTCSYAVANGELTIAVDPEQTGQLEGTIQRCVACSVSELVTNLDQQSTRAAGQRWQDGERPRWIAALASSIATFIKRCIGPGGIRSGWAGIHVTTLEAVFRWIEELKLWQLSGQFHHSRIATSSEDVDLALPLLEVQRKPMPPSELPQSKAA